MTIFGPDISNYQAGVDLRAVAAQGCEFVIAKVSEGRGYRSPAWPAQRDGARAAGLLLAGYHFITRDDPAAQAANCRAHLGDPTLPLALDWEHGGGDWRQFMAVLAAFRAAGLHVALGYCPGWYSTIQGNPDMRPAGLALWSSRYPTSTPATPAVLYRAVDNSPGHYWTGYGGLAPTLLQFACNARLAGRQMDCSAFRGTRAQLAALLAPTAATTQASAPTPTAAPAAGRRPLGEDTAMHIDTPAPVRGTPKRDWPTTRFSFGFDPPNGWGGRGVVKLHWSEPGGWLHTANWWIRAGAPATVGIPNRPHSPAPINVAGQQERFVGYGLELLIPELADELDVVLSAPAGVHLFAVYER